MEKLSFLDKCEQLMNEKLLRCRKTGYEPKIAKMIEDLKDIQLVLTYPNFMHVDNQLDEQIQQSLKYINKLEDPRLEHNYNTQVSQLTQKEMGKTVKMAQRFKLTQQMYP